MTRNNQSRCTCNKMYLLCSVEYKCTCVCTRVCLCARVSLLMCVCVCARRAIDAVDRNGSRNAGAIQSRITTLVVASYECASVGG